MRTASAQRRNCGGIQHQICPRTPERDTWQGIRRRRGHVRVEETFAQHASGLAVGHRQRPITCAKSTLGITASGRDLQQPNFHSGKGDKLA
ncbi:hypothetical protein TARUN_472 [Trichoderma arundinaceum]|uniref:Uncharacterized protein n=1 Tax=Trichoderma arundinaceum TaxID=490622 RepID=A0A395P095_TRIAR|nr:hypothetical protein TARUN_472 [Trichoderma arundinaceum]